MAKFLNNWIIALSVVLVCAGCGPKSNSKTWGQLTIVELKNLADKGDPQAQTELGLRFFNGTGVLKDEQEAVEWWRKAAEQGSPGAECNLGVYYSSSLGQGVPKDAQEAVKWYRKAAEQNWPAAEHDLGVAYGKGLGVAENKDEEFRWMQKSAEQGYVLAEVRMGSLYSSGGDKQDYSEAIKWFRKATDKGNAEGEFGLGYCDAVTKNYTDAFKWFQQAAIQGQPAAQYGLGVCYRDGRGTETNLSEAAIWFHQAATNGFTAAQEALDTLQTNRNKPN